MKSLFLLLVVLIFSTACDSQIGTAISTAATNIITGKAFFSGGDSAYEKLKSQNEINPYNSRLDGCQVPDKSSSLIPTISKIKDKMCTCQTWGTCDALSCNCKILCPNNFSILNRAGTAKDESEASSLSFTNGDQAFYNKDPNYAGYCWGHAVVTQRFNRLAKFDGESPKLYQGRENDEKRRDYYKSVIKKVNKNEPVDIVGYKNLNDFSSNPEVRELLQESVKDNWAENAMTVQGLKMIATSETQGTDYYNNLFDDIEYRLNNFQQPTIVFNEKGNAVYSHAVLVSSYGKNSKGERYLCLRDNNHVASETMNCRKKMILRQDGSIYYEGWHSEIGRVVLANSENSNTVEQVKNLRSKCLTDKNCSVE